MACTACLVCLVITVRGCCKHHLGRASASSGHNTNLEQSTFLRNLWLNPFNLGLIMFVKSKDIILKNRLINGMYCLPYMSC
jgi:hypothetical protein